MIYCILYISYIIYYISYIIFIIYYILYIHIIDDILYYILLYYIILYYISYMIYCILYISYIIYYISYIIYTIYYILHIIYHIYINIYQVLRTPQIRMYQFTLSNSKMSCSCSWHGLDDRGLLTEISTLPQEIWVCLKIGYIPNYSHLIGIMIINHWV